VSSSVPAPSEPLRFSCEANSMVCGCPAASAQI
jgi:hypothetical protein